ncbi:hypothetical protein [Burkholderia metallica]|uniref:hypothetical protein n=1 Tax=Burkholderia metallica TaxID=488729 RepID=UPI00158F183D|nr:hypothetical protein [Burkholderia metallica]
MPYFFEMPLEKGWATRGDSLERCGFAASSDRLDHECDGVEFLCVIDGAVLLDLEDQVFVLQTDDSAHGRIAGVTPEARRRHSSGQGCRDCSDRRHAGQVEKCGASLHKTLRMTK